MSGFVNVTDAEIDSATPEMLTDAAKIMVLMAKKGYNKFQQIFKLSTQSILSKPAGYSQNMGLYESHIFDNSPMNSKALHMELAIQQLQGQGLKHVISDKINVLEQLQKQFGKNIKVLKMKSDNLKIGSENIQLHGFEITKPNGQKIVHDLKLVPNGNGKIKNPDVFKHLKQRQNLMKYLQQEADSLNPNNPNKSGSQGTHGLSSCLAKVKLQASFGAAFHAIINYKLLLNKEFLKYFGQVATGAGVGAAQGAIEYSASTYLGEQIAGPVAAVLITTIFSTKVALQTGDWSRFGKNLGVNVISSAASTFAGYLTTAGLASLGVASAWVTIPAVIIISGLSYWGTSSLVEYATPLGKMTDKEMKLAYDNYKKHFEELGLKINQSYDDFAKNFSKGNLNIGTTLDWTKLAKDGVASQSSLGLKVYRETIRFIFTIAKYTSMRGDIRIGLKILIQQLQSA